MPPLCLILSDDLIDASRVTGDGRSVGLAVIHCRLLSDLNEAMHRRPAVVVIDLHFPGLDVPTIVESANGVGSKVVGFGAHVDAGRLRAARLAGCHEVVPRSAFFEQLAENLANWATK